MSIASVTSVTQTPAFPQNAAGIQPVAVKAGETAPTGQTQAPHHGRDDRTPPTDNTASAQAAASTTSARTGLNRVV